MEKIKYVMQEGKIIDKETGKAEDIRIMQLIVEKNQLKKECLKLMAQVEKLTELNNKLLGIK